jgi:hypothetical protein
LSVIPVLLGQGLRVRYRLALATQRPSRALGRVTLFVGDQEAHGAITVVRSGVVPKPQLRNQLPNRATRTTSGSVFGVRHTLDGAARSEGVRYSWRPSCRSSQAGRDAAATERHCSTFCSAGMPAFDDAGAGIIPVVLGHPTGARSVHGKAGGGAPIAGIPCVVCRGSRGPTTRSRRSVRPGHALTPASRFGGRGSPETAPRDCEVTPS